MSMLLPGMKPGAPSEVAGVLYNIDNVDSFDTTMTVSGPMLCVFLKNGKSFSVPIPLAAYNEEDESANAMSLRTFVDSLPTLCKFYSLLT